MPVRRAAVILAGGESRRMGTPKAWLDLAGEPMLHRVTRLVGAACPVVVVVATAGQPLPPLPQGVVRVDDPPDRSGGGPLVGAATGLDALVEVGADIVYLGAVDAAWLTTAHVVAMLDALAGDRTAMAVVPETGPSPDGTRIVHATSGAVRLPVGRDTATALLRSGQRALGRLYDGLAARRIAVGSLAEPDVVRSCNTPQDYEAARSWIAGQR